MRVALALAGRSLGLAWPNPAVGCVLVRTDDGAERVVGRGWTQRGGRPHGEMEALNRAGELARGSTAYISLEPCNHHGKTPPCAEALIAAGISRALVTIEDPDPRVSGRGIARLREAGIPTTVGVCADEARALNAGFFLRIREGRPLTTLKLATTLDGRIATRTGESQWITGEEARARAHGLRARYDAVMVGIGTAIHDDPSLTCRLPGLDDRSPIRVVVDSGLRLPVNGKLVRSASTVPLWVVTCAAAAVEERAALEAAGVTIIDAPADGDGRVDLAAMFGLLGGRGLTRVLVEGGGELAAGMLKAGTIDRIAWFRAPKLIGGDGLAAVAGSGLEAIADADSFQRLSVEPCGSDVLETYAREL